MQSFLQRTTPPSSSSQEQRRTSTTGIRGGARGRNLMISLLLLGGFLLLGNTFFQQELVVLPPWGTTTTTATTNARTMQEESATFREPDCLDELSAQDDAMWEPFVMESSHASSTTIQAAWDHYTTNVPQWTQLHRVIVHANGTMWYRTTSDNSTKHNPAVLLMVLKCVIHAYGMQQQPLPTLDLILNPSDDCVALKKKRKTPITVFPIWSWTRSNQCHDLFMPYWSFSWPYHPEPSRITPWSNRTNRLFFRGSSTGLHGPPETWDSAPRIVLSKYCYHNPERCDGGVTKLPEPLIKTNHSYLLKGYVDGEKAQQNYRYAILIDGNGPPSSRSLKLLQSGATLLRQESSVSEFWYPLFQRYVHYIPVADNISNVSDAMEWGLSHPVESEQMAQRSQALMAYMNDRRATCWWTNQLRRYGDIFMWRHSGVAVAAKSNAMQQQNEQHSMMNGTTTATAATTTTNGYDYDKDPSMFADMKPYKIAENVAKSLCQNLKLQGGAKMEEACWKIVQANVVVAQGS